MAADLWHEGPTLNVTTNLRSALSRKDVSRAVFLVLPALAALYLIIEHRAHVAGALGLLPYLLLLACPLMHLFHHHGHGHHHRQDQDVDKE